MKAEDIKIIRSAVVTANIMLGDFNLWRKHYKELSFLDQKEIYSAWYKRWPNQDCTNYAQVEKVISIWEGNEGLPIETVVELGCHRGYNAMRLMPLLGSHILWYGYDICNEAIEHGIFNTPRYFPQILHKPFQETILPHHQLFFSSQTLEHILLSEVIACIKHSAANYLLIQLPIGEYGMDWDDYYGSHIIEVGWTLLTAYIKKCGYALIFSITDEVNWTALFIRI